MINLAKGACQKVNSLIYKNTYHTSVPLNLQLCGSSEWSYSLAI